MKYIFRGWDNDKKCWVPSFYWLLSPEGNPVWAKSIQDRLKDPSANITPQKFLHCYDKNGAPIFEGDIIFGRSQNGIEFECPESEIPDEVLMELEFDGIKWEFIEIVGNVFQGKISQKEIEISNQI